MRYRFTQRFRRQYAQAPREIRSAFDRHLEFLLQNLRHPSLRAKKYVEADTYVIRSLIAHPK